MHFVRLLYRIVRNEEVHGHCWFGVSVAFDRSASHGPGDCRAGVGEINLPAIPPELSTPLARGLMRGKTTESHEKTSERRFTSLDFLYPHTRLHDTSRPDTSGAALLTPHPYFFFLPFFSTQNSNRTELTGASFFGSKERPKSLVRACRLLFWGIPS